MGKFDNRIRQLVLEDSAHGLSVAQICRKYGIKARSTVFLWRREARAVPPETISLRELQKMKAELAALRTENEILRRAGCSERSPKEIRQKAFLELCSDYPLKKLCKVLGLSFGDGEYLSLAVAGGDRVHGGVAINEGRREVQPLQFLDVLMDR